MEITQLFLEIINTVAIIIGVIMAVAGVNAWKKQLKGSTEYGLARRYLKAVYKIRDAINYVRNHFISIDEIATALKENGIENLDYSNNQQKNRAVYSKRWKKIIEAKTDLDIELLESEVVWGKESVDVIADLNAQINKLYVSLKMFLEERINTIDREIIYDIGDEDIFNPEVNKAIGKIESFLKPHLK